MRADLVSLLLISVLMSVATPLCAQGVRLASVPVEVAVQQASLSPAPPVPTIPPGSQRQDDAATKNPRMHPLLVILISAVFLYASMLSYQYLIFFTSVYFNRSHVQKRRIIQNPGEIPGDQAFLLQESAQLLQHLGFEHIGYFHQPEIYTIIQEGIYHRVFYHREHRVFATAAPAFVGTAHMPLHITFDSFNEQGLMVHTANYGTVFADTPGLVAAEFANCGNIEQQYLRHLKRLRENRPKDLSLTEYVHDCDRVEAAVFEDRARHGQVRPSNETVYRYTFSGALAYAARIYKAVRGFKPYGKSDRQRISPRAYAVAYLFSKKIGKQIRRHKSSGENWTLFLYSLLLFWLAFGFLFSWTVVPFLVVILLVHEFGHYAMMRFLGYENTHILFLPLLGAVAIGEPKYKVYYHQLAVFLAGPMPGVLLGIWVLWYHQFHTDMALLQTFGFLCLILNYFNLLPVLPLDGGRVVELLAAKYTPWVSLLLSLVSGVFFLGLFLFFLDVIALLILLILLALVVRQWRILQLLRLAPFRQPPQGDRENNTLRIFSQLSSQAEGTPQGGLALVGRLGHIETGVEYLLQPKLRTAQLWVGFLIYVFAVTFPVYLFAVAIQGNRIAALFL